MSRVSADRRFRHLADITCDLGVALQVVNELRVCRTECAFH